jgi:hypothetical protein
VAGPRPSGCVESSSAPRGGRRSAARLECGCSPTSDSLGPSARPIFEFGDDTLAACATPRGRPFPGDELSMPTQQRVGGCDRRDVAKDSPAEPVGQRGEPSPVSVGQSKAPATQLPAQQPILFNQIGDRISLATLQPAGDDQQQHPQSRDVEHGCESISETGFHAAAVDPVLEQYGLWGATPCRPRRSC